MSLCSRNQGKKNERNNNKKQNFSIRTLIAIKQTTTHKSREICFTPHYYLTNESKFAKVLHLYLPRSTAGERSKAHTRFTLQPVVLSLHNQSSLPFRTYVPAHETVSTQIAPRIVRYCLPLAFPTACVCRWGLGGLTPLPFSFHKLHHIPVRSRTHERTSILNGLA